MIETRCVLPDNAELVLSALKIESLWVVDGSYPIEWMPGTIVFCFQFIDRFHRLVNVTEPAANEFHKNTILL